MNPLIPPSSEANDFKITLGKHDSIVSGVGNGMIPPSSDSNIGNAMIPPSSDSNVGGFGGAVPPSCDSEMS